VTLLGKPESSIVRAIIQPMTEKMDEFAGWCENEIADLERVTSELTTDTLKLFELSRDFDEPEGDIRSAISSLSKLIETISSSNQSTAEFVDSLEVLPRLDKKMNKASRRLILVHKKLIEQNQLMQDNMSLGLHDLQQRIAEIHSQSGGTTPIKTPAMPREPLPASER
jgi:DNA repair ATPase RecN